MEAPCSVWLMAGAKDVLSLNVARVHVAVQAIVFVMVAGKDATTRAAVRVHKVARISARHMGEGSDARGASWGVVMEEIMRFLVTN